EPLHIVCGALNNLIGAPFEQIMGAPNRRFHRQFRHINILILRFSPHGVKRGLLWPMFLSSVEKGLTLQCQKTLDK
ncbi:MAG: hypothetical protein J6Y77_06515, partial [Paludibacteraceae bacterium]|nr:hypothetical protein [Paludibacteraceae bacterium]